MLDGFRGYVGIFESKFYSSHKDFVIFGNR
jgi:hypothetical protein